MVKTVGVGNAVAQDTALNRILEERANITPGNCGSARRSMRSAVSVVNVKCSHALATRRVTSTWKADAHAIMRTLKVLRGERMTLKIDGQKFGRLTALQRLGSRDKKVFWAFKCDCGTVVEMAATFVVRGHTSSCGCLRIERSRESVLSDISGHSFGRLAVLGRAGRSEGGRVLWSCRCECGSTVDVSAKNLLNGTKVSCGCRKREAREENVAARMVDFVGQRFGKLTVLRLVERTSRSLARWLCACDCGGMYVAPHGSLQQGRAISCGCARRDKTSHMPESAIAYAAGRRARRRNAGGTFTGEEVENLYQRQKGRCACCTKKLGNAFHRDHILALINGGMNDISNIQLLCPSCNLRKGRLDPLEWARRNGRLI